MRPFNLCVSFSPIAVLLQGSEARVNALMDMTKITEEALKKKILEDLSAQFPQVGWLVNWLVEMSLYLV